MIKNSFKIDENGFIADSVMVAVDDYGSVLYFINEDGEEDTKDLVNIVSKDLPQPCYFTKPRWDGSDWVEGESEEEKFLREEESRLEALIPSAEQLQDSELEIKVLTLLMEMEVI